MNGKRYTQKINSHLAAGRRRPKHRDLIREVNIFDVTFNRWKSSSDDGNQ